METNNQHVTGVRPFPMEPLASTDEVSAAQAMHTVVCEPGTPTAPLYVQTGIRIIDAATPKEDAQKWLEELETLYDTHFAERPATWTWYHAHSLDHEAFIALQEVLDSCQFARAFDHRLAFYPKPSPA